MKQVSKESGFSLIELVISIGVLTVVMGAAFQILDRSLASYDANQILTEAHANSDFAVLRITELLRGAGANPGATSVVSTAYITNYIDPNNAAGGSSPSIVNIRSDLNGNGLLTDRVQASGTLSFIISSENIRLQHVSTPTTIAGVAVPANCIVQIDNTPNFGGSTDSGVPIVVAQNIVGFTCDLFPTGTLNPKEAVLTITAGPSRPMLATNPRYRVFTSTVRVKLRNR